MFPRFCFLLLSFTTLVPALIAQDLPSYLTEHYPAQAAVGVPTNTKIFLRIVAGYAISGVQFSLKSQTGTTVALESPVYFNTEVTISPATPLAASTRYTLTATPPPNSAAAYTFTFTTGSGPDNTPPRLIGFDP